MRMLHIDANPFAYDFALEQTALVLIDLQRDFTRARWLRRDARQRRVAARSHRARHAGRAARLGAAGGLVVHTREAHRPDLSDCPPAKRNRGAPTLRIGDEGPMGRILVAGEAGNQIIEALAPVAGELVIDKPGKGMFYATGLHERLQMLGITHLLFGGVTTEVCVQTSMREANDRGYDGLLLEDCTESYFPAFKAAALDMIRAQGAIVGWRGPGSALIAALAALDARGTD